MFKTWNASSQDVETLGRDLEAHLNEFAEDVVSVGYAISGLTHHVLAVYRELDTAGDSSEEAAVAVAERIIDDVQ